MITYFFEIMERYEYTVDADDLTTAFNKVQNTFLCNSNYIECIGYIQHY